MKTLFANAADVHKTKTPIMVFGNEGECLSKIQFALTHQTTIKPIESIDKLMETMAHYQTCLMVLCLTNAKTISLTVHDIVKLLNGSISHLIVLSNGSTANSMAKKLIGQEVSFLSLDISMQDLKRACNQAQKNLRQRSRLLKKSKLQDWQIKQRDYEDQQTLKKLNDLIIAHYKNNQLKTAELASMMNMSLRTFERKCLELTGKLPKQYLLEYRLQVARQLVCNTYLPFSQIALEVGIGSSSYFSIRFFERFQITASQLRTNFQRVAS